MSDLYDNRPRSDSSDVASRKIFIGGLSYSTDEDKLKRYFRDYGIVQDAVVMKDPVTKRSRGFGFITFFDMLSVDSVLAAEPHIIDGRKVEAKRAVPRSEMSTGPSVGVPMTSSSMIMGKIGTPVSSPTSDLHKSPSQGGGMSQQNVIDDSAYNKVFVGGLHYDTRDQEFRDYFSRFGKVVHGEVMFNRETHKSRGFGFVVFESADAALRSCDVREHIIDGKVVEVKLAIPRSKIGTPTSNTPSSSTPNNSNTMNGYLNMMNMNMMMTPNSSASSSNNHSALRGRTMSTGSTHNHSHAMSPPVPLSGNSSTLAAAQGSHKIGPGILSGNSNNNSSNNNNNGLNNMNGGMSMRQHTSRNISSPLSSYATALRIGNPTNNNTNNSSSSMNGGSGLDDFLGGEDPLAGAYVEDFVIENVRPSRALSEPIVRYEGSGSSNQHYYHNNNSNNANTGLFSSDLLNFGSFLHQPAHPHHSPTQYPSSQNVSRSSSIVQAQTRGSFTLSGNMSPEPIFGTNDALHTVNHSLAEKLFNDSGNSVIGGGNSLSGLLFPSSANEPSLVDSNLSPNSILLSTGNSNNNNHSNTNNNSKSEGSRRSSFANGGPSSNSGNDIWATAGLSNQTTSESLWASNFSENTNNLSNANSSNNNTGLLGAIGSQSAYSRSRTTSKDDTFGSSLLLPAVVSTTIINDSLLGDIHSSNNSINPLPPAAQRRYSNSSGVQSNSDGIASTNNINYNSNNNSNNSDSNISALSELRLNSHEYDLHASSNTSLTNTLNLGNTWGSGF